MNIISEHAPYFIAKEGRKLLVCRMEGMAQKTSYQLAMIPIAGRGGLGRAFSQALREIVRQRAIAAWQEIGGKRLVV